MSFQQVSAPAPQPPPGRIDLDRVEAEAAQFAAGGWVATYVPPMAAELRAAREAIDAADALDAGIYLGARDVLTAKLAAYHQAVGR